MSSYRGTADRPEKVKAILAVVAVHAVLALVILTGLKVQMVRHAVEHLTTVDIEEPPPVPPPPPAPTAAPKPAKAKGSAAPPAPKAQATPVVAPPRKLPVPSTVLAAKVAGSGEIASSGAAPSGNGSGAGGWGNGRGGGGYADYSQFTPARRITKIPDFEYRRLASTGIASGSAGVTILVNRDGSVSDCRVARSSGDASIDALMCQLTLRYVRFSPALDPGGRPVAQEVTFFPNWRRR